MTNCIAELPGTTLGRMLWRILGNGVAANVLLDRPKCRPGGWLVVAAGKVSRASAPPAEPIIREVIEARFYEALWPV